MADEFTCALCGGTFVKGRTDEEALAEARSLFTPAELKETAVICGDCFRDFAPQIPRIREELRRD